MAQTPVPQPAHKKMKILPLILIILAVLFVLCFIIGLISNGSPSGKATATARSLTQTVEAIPTQTPVPTAAEPTATFDPISAYDQYISNVLGSGNRNVPRLRSIDFDMPSTGDIRISWNINDNLTEDLIKTGIQLDATDLLQAVDEGSIPFQRVILEGYFPMVDAYGKTTDEMVVHLIYNKDTIDKIQWSNFLYTNIYLIADKAVLAPAVQ